MASHVMHMHTERPVVSRAHLGVCLGVVPTASHLPATRAPPPPQSQGRAEGAQRRQAQPVEEAEKRLRKPYHQLCHGKGRGVSLACNWYAQGALHTAILTPCQVHEEGGSIPVCCFWHPNEVLLAWP